MSAPPRFRYVSSDRRVREDRRFVVGKGRFVADIALPGTRHVALVTCPHPAARIVSIDKRAALAMPGVHYVLDGAELAAATLPLMTGLDTPNVPRRPLAVDVARYAGEWVAAVVADSRALAEDAAEAVAIEYEPLPFVLDGEEAYRPGSPLVHEAHGSNVLLDRSFVWGEVDKDFAESPHHLSLHVEMGPQLDGADRDLRRGGELGSVARDPRRLCVDPDAEISRPDRGRAQAAGLGRARAPRRRRRRQLRGQARHQAHGAWSAT